MVKNREVLLEIKRSTIEMKIIFYITMGIAFLSVGVAIKEHPWNILIVAFAIIYLAVGFAWGYNRKFRNPPTLKN